MLHQVGAPLRHWAHNPVDSGPRTTLGVHPRRITLNNTTRAHAHVTSRRRRRRPHTPCPRTLSSGRVRSDSGQANTNIHTIIIIIITAHREHSEWERWFYTVSAARGSGPGSSPRQPEHAQFIPAHLQDGLRTYTTPLWRICPTAVAIHGQRQRNSHQTHRRTRRIQRTGVRRST